MTGATGFLGQRVLKNLLNLKHKVSILARDNNKRPLVDKQHKFQCITYNITHDNVTKLTLPQDIDKVLHLAWGNLAHYNDKKHSTLYPNEHLKFLNYLVNMGIKDFTIMGTSFEYGLLEGALAEDMPCMPVTEYGKGKLKLYEDFSKHCSAHGIDLKWLRLFYVYADDQAQRTIWGQLHHALQTGAKEFNMSYGEQQRDYLHADVAAKIIANVCLQNKIKDIINIGNGKGIKIIDLVQKFLTRHHMTIQLNKGVYPYPEHEPFAFWANITKLKQLHDNSTE